MPELLGLDDRDSQLARSVELRTGGRAGDHQVGLATLRRLSGLTSAAPASERLGVALRPAAFDLLTAAGVALAQVALGVLSVTTVLAVPAVSLHTLGAALLLAILVALTTLTYEPESGVSAAVTRPALAVQPATEDGR